MKITYENYKQTYDFKAYEFRNWRAFDFTKLSLFVKPIK